MVLNGGSRAVKHITEWKFVPLFYTTRPRLSLRSSGLAVFCRRGLVVEQKTVSVMSLIDTHALDVPALRRCTRESGLPIPRPRRDLLARLPLHCARRELRDGRSPDKHPLLGRIIALLFLLLHHRQHRHSNTLQTTGAGREGTKRVVVFVLCSAGMRVVLEMPL
ncbi:hypothetical protein E2C01_004710 [Portunus trituberculatus]|uniref:Uncharacterized protein n=1 Tax=Portunus trituberculatus TaxID=210409 RepID=A0A5B7CX56_PORTR|nr:hypothetical protein [Portunus trituberculatus]